MDSCLGQRMFIKRLDFVASEDIAKLLVELERAIEDSVGS
jgi:hypothetical protein